MAVVTLLSSVTLSNVSVSSHSRRRSATSRAAGTFGSRPASGVDETNSPVRDNERRDENGFELLAATGIHAGAVGACVRGLVLAPAGR
jgi:hypothetical protein